LHAGDLGCSEGLIFNPSFDNDMATHPKTSTGIGRGGKRENAGRPRGALGKRSRELLAQAKAESLEMPVARLLRRMNDASLEEDYRDHLAAIAAPYTAPRLSAVSVTKRPAEMTDEEIAGLLALTEEGTCCAWELDATGGLARCTEGPARGAPGGANAAPKGSVRRTR
jgi:hypothetical protein